MKNVKYIGAMAIPAKTRRELDPPSLERLGVDYSHGTAIWSPENSHILEMTSDGGDALVAALPNEFAITEDEPGEMMQPMTNLHPQLNLDGESTDETDDDDESSDDD